MDFLCHTLFVNYFTGRPLYFCYPERRVIVVQPTQDFLNPSGGDIYLKSKAGSTLDER
jgi:hypothetical protein